MITLLLTLALGGPNAELAETALLLVDNGEPLRARTMAQEALGTSRDAQLVLVYLDASAEAGLGPQALAETRGWDVQQPWDEDAAQLVEAVADGNETSTLRVADRLREVHATHPELLAPLWSKKDLSKKVMKLREAVLRDVPEDPAAQARLLRLRQLVNQPDTALRVAVEQHLEVDAFGPPATDVELHDHARSLSEKGLAVADLDLRAEERRAVVERAHPMFLEAGRPGDAAKAWDELGASDSGAVGARAEALRQAGDAEGAKAALDAGWRALGLPMPDDVVVADGSRRATWAAELLAAASEQEAAAGQGGHAWAYSVAATAFAGELRGAGGGPVPAQSLAASYPGNDKVGVALGMAAKATDAAERLTHVKGAWTAVAAGASRREDVERNPDVYLDALYDVWREAALLFAEEGGDPHLALAFGTLALASGPGDHVLEALLATLHDQVDGEVDHSYAAFHHAAVARGLGADGAAMTALIAKHHQGLGEADAVAVAIGGETPKTVKEPARRTARVPTGRKRPPPKGGAVIGEPIPDFKVETAYGSLSRSSLSGRVVVFTFFTSDYGPSVEQLKVAGVVTRQLRARGVDAVHVGISQDTNRGAFDDLHRVGQRWGQLAWAPEVAERFGVPRQPTTWVVDRNGNARYFVDHRISGADLTRVIEGIAVQ